ncbi:SagB/ThcOx family dehydrogenase [uncultured Victivallis sp.]|uniref:nitroreductase family protein n=1 Tax=uncultured Victivallis sp. TaxID=354118 RepID=UPI0025FCF852|nr:SagB/ThcOx family dehydrogenase [uncultured Victivallis sp.]
MKIKNLTCLAALAVAGGISAADIELPKPETTGGMPLQEALANRRTDRKFSSKPLSREMLSNLLWSALGVNRADGKRTAPTARNQQEITLYVCIPEGTFRYDATANKLVQTSEKRAGDAPLMLVYVADLGKLPERLCHVDCGFVGQNVYLFCASEKLATVFRGSFRERDYKPLLNLKDKEKILYVQAVGFPE